MSPLHLSILVVGGLLTGLLVFGLVYLDSGRYGVSGSTRLLLAAGFGVSSLCSSLVPYVVEAELRYAYFQFIKSRPIAVSPTEWLAVSIATGLLLSVFMVGIYLLGTRYKLANPTANAS